MDLKDGLINRADKKYTYGNIAVFSLKIFAGEKSEFSKLFPWLYQFVDQQLVSGEIYKGPWLNVRHSRRARKMRINGLLL